MDFSKIFYVPEVESSRRAIDSQDHLLQKALDHKLIEKAKLALETSQRGYVMESGEITLTDDAPTLLHDPKVREAYLGE